MPVTTARHQRVPAHCMTCQVLLHRRRPGAIHISWSMLRNLCRRLADDKRQAALPEFSLCAYDSAIEAIVHPYNS